MRSVRRLVHRLKGKKKCVLVTRVPLNFVSRLTAGIELVCPEGSPRLSVVSTRAGVDE
jgi:hypothetical protein